jgi:hypothetical protein
VTAREIIRLGIGFVLLSTGCFPKAPIERKAPAAPAVLTCATDADCVLFDEGYPCCGTVCGDEGGVSTRAHADAYRAWEQDHCKTLSVECPQAKCPKMQPWDTRYKAACVESTCQAKKSVVALPDKASLLHFCSRMAAGPSKAVQAAPAAERQSVWMAEMSDAAKAAQISGWNEFHRHLHRVPKSHKKNWLQAGVIGRGLQAECAVILSQGDMK